MNLIQLRLLQARGWEFLKTERRRDLYVAIATKQRPDGVMMKAEAGHPTLRKAENRLVHIIVDEPRHRR